MKIFEWEVNNKVLIVVGAVFGGGACYALYKYLTKWSSSRSLRGKASKRARDGEPDLELPLVLEHEYGSFRRVIQDADPVAARYLHEIPDHFFSFKESLLRFVADISTKHATRYKHALVIGSGTGCLVFRLAKIFDEVKGLEASFSQVVTCYQFQNHKTVSYFFPAEGSLKTVSKSVQSPVLTSSTSKKTDGKKRKNNQNSVEFFNVDLDTQHPSYFGEFQVVIVKNCFEDLDDPVSFLSSLKACVEIDGFLFISTNYNWRRNFNQPTGFTIPDVTSSFELLKHLLEENFKLLEEKNIPDIICESTRSSRIHYNHVTAWVRINVIEEHTKSDGDKS